MSSKLENIQTLIYDLTKDERGRLREWFDEFDGDSWDVEFTADVKGKKLDDRVTQAKTDAENGRTKDV